MLVSWKLFIPWYHHSGVLLLLYDCPNVMCTLIWAICNNTNNTGNAIFVSHPIWTVISRSSIIWFIPILCQFFTLYDKSFVSWPSVMQASHWYDDVIWDWSKHVLIFAMINKSAKGAYTWSSPDCRSMCEGSEYMNLSVTKRKIILNVTISKLLVLVSMSWIWFGVYINNISALV